MKDNGVKSIIRSGRSGGRTGLCVSASAGRGDRRALAHLLGLLKSATSLDLHLRKDTFKMYPQGRHPVSNINYIDSLCSGISAQERVHLLHRWALLCRVTSPSPQSFFLLKVNTYVLLRTSVNLLMNSSAFSFHVKVEKTFRKNARREISCSFFSGAVKTQWPVCVTPTAAECWRLKTTDGSSSRERPGTSDKPQFSSDEI